MCPFAMTIETTDVSLIRVATTLCFLLQVIFLDQLFYRTKIHRSAQQLLLFHSVFFMDLFPPQEDNMY